MKRGVRGAVLVGGASTRMGGAPKGLLRTASGETILERWARLFAELGIPHLLVGDAASYGSSGHGAIPDDPPGIGPLGGLVAALRAGEAPVVVVACDMPFVSRALLERLATHPSEAAIVAARRDDRYEPLFARYDPARVLPVAEAHVRSRELSLQKLLRACAADVLPLSDEEAAELRDWDTPEDVAAK